MPQPTDRAPPSVVAPARRHRHLTLAATPAALEQAHAAVADLAGELGWEAAPALQVSLVLEELITNTVDYGYAGGPAGRIKISLDASPHDVGIVLEDDGIPFDPFQVPPPDLTLGLEERPIGGLGVHFVRSYMDRCEYRREPGRNRVELYKRWRPADA